MKNYYYLLFIVFLSVSCVPQRKIVYVQSKIDKKEYRYSADNKKTLRIESFDILFITISSLDQQGYNYFSAEKGSASSVTETSLSVLGYTVSDSGSVTLPLIGSVKVKGLTLNEAERAIVFAAKNILNTPIVSVRFVNNTVTILGEVQRPGTYTYPKEQLSIFRAIGLAGDITEYGNKLKITLIREKDKVIYKNYIDITKDDIFTSEYYYLKPNDVIYVQPLKVRRWGVKDFKDLPISLILTTVTTFILLQSFINK